MLTLFDKKAIDFEVIAEFPTYLKVPLSGFTPPCIINLKA